MPFTIKMFKKMFLQTSLTSRKFSVITFINVPAISETICVLPTYCLREFLHVKRYIKNLLLQSKLMCHCAGKCFRFRYIETYMTPVDLAFTRSCLLFHWINFSSNWKNFNSPLDKFQLLMFLGLRNDTIRSWLKHFFNLVIHVKQM